MSRAYQYFTIPFHLASSVQSSPTTMWYATWSTTPPTLEPGMPAPLVIGATIAEPPAEAVLLGSGAKDPPPPPPPPAPLSMTDYQACVGVWLGLARAADE